MINQCKPEVASWSVIISRHFDIVRFSQAATFLIASAFPLCRMYSCKSIRSDDGEMFIVKDTNELSRRYIPQYFGHSNFSSFDRQLNFYGFRKSFPDALRQANISNVQTELSKESAKHVRFYHQYFKRGRTDLFHLIKRASTKKRSSVKKNNKSSVKRKRGEIEELREELSSLECRLTSVSSQIEKKFAQLSKDIEDKIEAMRGVVSDASNRLFQTQQHLGRGNGLNSTRPLEAGEGYVVERFPQISTFGTSKTTEISSAYDDLSLDARPLTNIQQSNSRIGRLLSEDFVSLLKPSNTNPPVSPNMNFQRTTSTSSKAKSDIHDDFSKLLRKKQGLTYSRSTTEEIFNLFSNPSESISPELAPRANHDKHPASFLSGGAFTLLPEGTLNQSKTASEVYKADNMNLNPPSRSTSRITTEDFFGVLLERQNKMRIERATSSEYLSNHGPSTQKASNDYVSLHSLYPHPPDAPYMRCSSDDANNAFKPTAGNLAHTNKVYNENKNVNNDFLRGEGFSLADLSHDGKFATTGATDSSVPLFSIDLPNQGVNRMTTEDFFGEYLETSNGNQANYVDGNEAAALLMFASQNMPKR
jgi:hypothetical protein